MNPTETINIPTEDTLHFTYLQQLYVIRSGSTEQNLAKNAKTEPIRVLQKIKQVALEHYRIWRVLTLSM